MADTTPQIKQQSSANPPNKKTPSKFYSHFLFKTLIITVFLAIIPLFPSESPVFGSSQSRGWELLYLVFVGIAVSYGLFSRRRNHHDDLERENNAKIDSAHSYMSRLLQFPSVFDDEVETPSTADDHNHNHNNGSNNNSNTFQSWSSLYHRNEPMLVVAKRGSVHAEKSRVDEKPLLLPVRSLKSRVSDGNDVGDGVSRVFARSNSMPTFAKERVSGNDGGEFEEYESPRVSNRSSSSSSSSSKGSDHGSRRMSGNDGGEFVYGQEYETSRVPNRSSSSLSSSSNDSRRMRRHGSLKPQVSVPNEFGYANEDNMEDYGTSRVSNGSNSSLGSKGSDNDSRRIRRHGSSKSQIPVPTEFGYLNEIEDNGVSREDYETFRGSNGSNSSMSSKGFSNDSRRMSKHGSLKSQTSVPTEFGGYVNEDNGVARSLRRSTSGLSLSPRGFSSISSQGSNGKYEDFDDEHMEEKVVEGVVLSSPIPWQTRSRRVKAKGDRSNSPITFSPLPSMVGVEPSRSFMSQSPRSSQSNSPFSSPTKQPSPRKAPPSIPLPSESQAKNVEDLGRRSIVYSSCLPPIPPPPPPPPPPPISTSRMVKSRSSSRIWSEPKGMSRENRTQSLSGSYEIVEEARNELESSLVGKSVRTIRPHETIGGAGSTIELEEEHEKKSAGYDTTSNERFSEFPKETRDFLEGLLVETDDDSESEDNEDNYVESKAIEQTEKLEEELPSNSITDEGPDVDKKADEFIAKFREQIRLQRIASIKRSTGELKRSS